MFCKNCGIQTDDNANYCPNCGAALKAEIAAADRAGSHASYDKSDALYGRPAGRKDAPVRGSLSILPIFGIMGVVLMVITLMVTYYNFNMIDGLQKNLNQYYSQLTDSSLIGKISSPMIDFFTNGALTQKREDIHKMAADLVKGRDFMSGGLSCAFLSVITSLAGVLRNIKKPTAGRLLFSLACVFSLAAPVLVVTACVMLYLINTLLIINITASFLAFVMLVVESQRVKIFMSAYNYNYPYKRPPRGAPRNK